MDYQKLAQRIVALGVGVAERDAFNGTTYYRSVGGIQLMSAETFCNDGRVALAMMEKALCGGLNLTIGPTPRNNLPKWWAEIGGVSFVRNDSLAVAINHVCCNALKRA